ncbi:MAG: tetratricopeptide repeat protein [Tepidisphaeraceae bacterium]|jgi:tetratricopeptide (TPR) repeat protein
MNQAESNVGRARWMAPLLVICIGAIAYSNSLEGPFIFDDRAAIVLNPQICSLNPFKFASPGPTSIASRPLVIFSFEANYAIGRLTVQGYHLTNLLIHLSAAMLLYGIVRRTLLRKEIWGGRFGDSANWLAAMVAAVWVAHPLDTQSVTYIVQRSEALAGLFLLASVYCVMRSAGGGKYWGIMAVIACALGMASKEIAVVAPLLAVLYDRTFLAGTFRQAMKARWKIYIGMAGTWVVLIVSLHMGHGEGLAGFDQGISPIEWTRTELNVIARYLRLAFWPTDLTLDYYDWPMARHWADVSWQGWGVLALAIGSLAAVRYKPWLGFLGAWFFLILAPTSSILPIKQEAAAEQRMYLPLAALACLVVVCGWGMVGRRRPVRWAAGIAGCILIVVLVRLTMGRNDQYATSLDIWTDTVAKRPDNTRARVNLGEAWAQASLDFPRGSVESMAATSQALKEFQTVLAMEPRVSEAVFAIGQSLERLGNPMAAEQLYTEALPKYPDVAADLLVERGTLRARREDWNDAKDDFVAAIKANPGDVEAHYFLGVLYQQQGDWADAKIELEKTVGISPKYKDAAERLRKVNGMF